MLGRYAHQTGAPKEVYRAQFNHEQKPEDESTAERIRFLAEAKPALNLDRSYPDHKS